MFVKNFESSLIKSVGYSHGNLTIALQGGKGYVYTRVPRKVFDELCAADSKGKYYNEKIKGVYEAEPLEEAV